MGPRVVRGCKPPQPGGRAGTGGHQRRPGRSRGQAHTTQPGSRAGGSRCAPKPPGAGASPGGRQPQPAARAHSHNAARGTAWPPPPSPLGPVSPAPGSTLSPIKRLSPPPAPPRPHPRAAHRQPMGGRVRHPVRASRAEPAQSEKSEPNPSGPLLRTCRPPPAAASSPRIGCTVPTRKSSSAARQRRGSAMTQEYDK